jgi:hypothetical protein
MGAIGVLVWAWILPGGDATARVRGLADEPIEDVYQGFGRDRITPAPRFAEGMFTPALETAAPTDNAVVVSLSVVADPQLVRQERCPGR